MKQRLVLTVVAMVGVFLVVGEPSCAPPEAPMTITAETLPICDFPKVRGTVSPAKATPKVILQRTSGGKWVDWAWYSTWLTSEQKHVLSAVPTSSGGYEIQIAEFHGGASLSGTLHLRVRSAGGGYTSPGMYYKVGSGVC